MNYAKAQTELKAKFPTIYHKYSFFGEVRTYKNKLTMVGDDVEYIGVTKKYINHWDVKSDAKGRIVRVCPEKTLMPAFEYKQPLYLYFVDGEPRYYNVQKSLTDFDLIGRKVEYQGIKFGLPKSKPTPVKTVHEIIKYKKEVVARTSISRTIRKQRVHVDEVKPMLRKNISDGEHSCCYCGLSLEQKNYTLDHIIPIVRGGTNEAKNLRPCCEACNAEKGGLMLHSYIQLLCLNQSEMKTGSKEYLLTQTKIINANEIAKSLDKN